MTTTEAVRYYWRCRDCLSGTVTETFGSNVDTICGLCGGALRLLGPVDAANAHWIRVVHLTPCDGRCTHARGRRCECGCLGRNHGAGLVTIVERVGGTVRLQPTFDSKGAAERAAEYREARQRVCEAATTRWGERWPSHIYAALAEVEALSTQQGRLKRLARILWSIERGY
jgi:hypothetical protein